VIEYPGIKYPGRMKVKEIFEELQWQAKNYEDYVLPTSKMVLVPNAEHGFVLDFCISDKDTRSVPLSRRAVLQIAQWIGLPTNSRLYKRLRWGTDNVKARRTGKVSDRFWATLLALVNDHFRLLKSRKLVRLLKDHDEQWYVRALMSDAYKIIPNDQLFMVAAEKIKTQEAEVWDARLSEDAFYLYAVAPGISAQIRTDRTFDAEGRWVGDAGDAVNAAVMLRNSETGQGGCEVCPAIVSKVHGSYFVSHNSLSVRHVGKRHKMDMLLSSATIRKENSLIFDQVRDYIESTFNPDKFQEFVDTLNDATQDELEDPAGAAEAVRLVYDLSEERKNSVIAWLLESGDKSRYGLAKAVAREAHDNDRLGADEALHMERVSSDLITKQTALKLAKAYKSKAELKALKSAATAEESVDDSSDDDDALDL
jgi:hypothetical protein